MNAYTNQCLTLSLIERVFIVKIGKNYRDNYDNNPCLEHVSIITRD